ncbi:MAG: winged helix DNA-binding domain-containing protein [Propionibacteriaceae bacterium]
MVLTAAAVIGLRIAAQQLDRAPAERALTDAAIFDLGIQDTGSDSASWALVNRGVPVDSPESLAGSDDIALVWSLRASPHFYRRSDLLGVLTAVSPFSEADAGKRIISAAQPLKAAGISARDGLSEVAGQLRRLVQSPTVKGELSTRVSAVLDEPYLKDCVPCGAVHVYEMPFRLGALYGGLELAPGTSPPLLKRIPGWPHRPAGPDPDPTAAPEHLQVIRNYLRFLGPAAPKDVAGFLDASLADVKAHWPEDAVEVSVEGAKAWTLGEPDGAPVDSTLVRLLGPYDLLLQGRDRHVLVSDKAHHKALWPTIGRPGAVLSGTEIIGTWRPKASGSKFSVRLDTWVSASKAVRARIEEQAALLAAHRGLTFAGLLTD